jgi:hypothetical protein
MDFSRKNRERWAEAGGIELNLQSIDRFFKRCFSTACRALNGVFIDLSRRVQRVNWSGKTDARSVSVAPPKWRTEVQIKARRQAL